MYLEKGKARLRGTDRSPYPKNMRYQGQELSLNALAFCYQILFLKLSQSGSSYTDPNSAIGQPDSQ